MDKRKLPQFIRTWFDNPLDASLAVSRDSMLEIADEIERLQRCAVGAAANTTNAGLEKEAEYLRKLVATHDKWVYALGRLSCLHPTMLIDVNDPEGMAAQIEAHVRASCPNLDRISPLPRDLSEPERG